jgi:hypothetical protein
LLLLQPLYATGGMLAYDEDDDLLAPLSALQHLTRLQLPAVRRVQLRALQLPQLQQLTVKLQKHHDGEQLQLSQLAALQQLTVTEQNNRHGMTGSDELPGGLLELCWDECWQGQCTVQPLLGLTQLQKLRLYFKDQPPAAEQVQQLSTLSSLQEVLLACVASPVACVEAVAVATWPVLPLTELRLASIDLASAALLQQLQQLQGLTELTLAIREYGEQVQLTLSEVAAMVRNLPALQHLSLQRLRFKATVEAKEKGSRKGMYHDAAGVEELLQAISSLRELESAYEFLPLKLLKAAAQEVKGRLPQLLGSLLEPWCAVEATILQIDTREGIQVTMCF